MKYLIISLILTTFSGCASTPVEAPIGTPARPVLSQIPQWGLIPNDAKEVITLNDMALKQYIVKLEGRIKRHDSPLVAE